MDAVARRHWHFPVNLPKRQYQFEIIQHALLHNTLVVLPTGLGKTFIAAVVMYNYARWFPQAKIIFLAPTRPLVSQQKAAIMGMVELAVGETAELTGGRCCPQQRTDIWKNKRIFFCTPQILDNDLTTGVLDPSTLVLLVFDEAHHAVGNYAYCKVVRMISTAVGREAFRILALTATPASNVATVQDVINNLSISRLAIRSEDSPDVLPYLHERTVETIVVRESPEMAFVRKQLESTLILPYLNKLYQTNAYHERDPSKISSFDLIQARSHFRQQRFQERPPYAVEHLFAVLILLARAHEFLEMYGIGIFATCLSQLWEEESAAVRSRSLRELESNLSFQQLKYIQIQTTLPLFISHPKIELVERILLEHFNGALQVGRETRSIVFSHYRESVHELVRKLGRHAPLLKVMSFVGQSTSNRANTSHPVTQQQQVRVLEAFRTGGYNVLVATCIAEEGLDIGNVDLIICFDMQTSPIRMLQRVGRTGRHRPGRIVLLQSAGREEQRYKKTLYQYRAVQNAMANPAAHFVLFQPKHNLIGENLPQCIERVFDPSSTNIGSSLEKTKCQKKRAAEIPLLPSCPGLTMTCSLFVKPGRFIASQKTPGPTFLIGHSESSRRLLSLHRQFDALRGSIVCEGMMRQEMEPEKRPLEELALAASTAMSEMSIFREFKARPALSLQDYGRLFDLLYPEEIGCIKVPIDFFDHSRSNTEPKMVKRQSPSPPQENPYQVVSTVNSTPIIGLVKEEKPDRPLLMQPINQGAVPSPATTPLKAPDNNVISGANSSKQVPAPPDNNHSSTLSTPIIAPRNRLAVHQLDSSASPSLTSCKRGPLQDIRKYFDVEASCDDDLASLGHTASNETISTSMAAFIDDAPIVSVEEDTSSVCDLPSSADMMAFYRRTAFQSQPDSRFKTAPMQFARKLKLKDLSLLPDQMPDSTAETKEAPSNAIEMTDWPSEFDL